MISWRRHLRKVAGIALVAMLALASMPTVSRALALAQAGTTDGNCGQHAGPHHAATADGASQGGTAGPETTHQGTLHLDHCGFCVLLASLAGLPPTPAPPPVAAQWSETYPPLFLAAPRPFFAWLTAQPRAPPVLSA